MTDLGRALEVADRMSALFALMDRYGSLSAEVTDFAAVVEDDPELRRLVARARRVHPRIEAPPLPYSSLWEKEETPTERAWRVCEQGGAYALRVLPMGRHTPPTTSSGMRS